MNLNTKPQRTKFILQGLMKKRKKEKKQTDK
jgi:hypothetical protein